jgi:hypothetical protein
LFVFSLQDENTRIIIKKVTLKVVFICGFNTVSANVLQLGEVADLEALTFNLALMFIRNPNVQFCTKPAILPNCC